MLKFLVKVGILGGTIYSLDKVGVWGSPKESEALYNEMNEAIRPHLPVPDDMPIVPQEGELRFLTTHYWNMGVKKTCSFLAVAPDYAREYTDKAKNYVHNLYKDFVNRPKPVEKPKAEKPKVEAPKVEPPKRKCPPKNVAGTKSSWW